ncbi:alpha/beta fold hydrolase [Nonomuraea sp. MTCD27]|uniref:alpha/beta fold hydrolase n=1 Tax=Nonomuraea sp. MTCD27 TaxID=1676747 RepID=UPI0035BEF9F5
MIATSTPETSPSWIRTTLAGAGLAIVTLATVGLTGTPAADAAAAERAMPTVILEHGAFADASSWTGVVKRLRHDGYPVIAAANPLRSPASDAAHLRGLVDSVRGPVVLVGHSYGGSVISTAADGDDQVKALVYIAAFAPDTGESAADLAARFPGSTLSETLEPVPFTLPDGTSGTDLYIDQDKFRRQFAADVPATITKVMAAAQRPVTAAALEEKATKAAWKTIPSWTLITTRDRNIPAAAQRFMARRARSHAVEVDASHAVSVSRPDTVTRLIEQAANATVR